MTQSRGNTMPDTKTQTTQPTIFISYSWKNKDIADAIDNDWKAVGITLVRDVRDLTFKTPLKEFMKRVKETDYVLLVISKAYLESKNCMYETLELLEEPKFKDRILPIVLDDANITTPQGKISYIKYWDEQIKSVNKEIEGLVGNTNLSELYEELNQYNKIRDNVSKFIAAIVSMRYLSWDGAKAENYKPIFDYIGFNEQNILEETIRIFNIGDTEEQEIALDKLSRQHPKNENVLFLKATIAYLTEKKYKKARTLCEEIIQLYPNFFEATYNLAYLLDRHFQSYPKAKELYEKAIAINPNDADAYNNLAILLQQQFQDFDKAKELYKKAIAINPNYADAYNNLAILLETQFQDFDKAKELYKKAIAINPNYADAYNNLAALLKQQFQDYPKAKELYEKAIAINPNLVEAYYNLALLLFGNFKDIENSRIHYLKAIELNSQLKNEEFENLLGIK
ncbi:MAG: tetratricopeptide repeat protein [Ignavibacteriales bacterium]|nr:tetratricopeptide repeat protein [Ignavibacteriales bacterium]